MLLGLANEHESALLTTADRGAVTTRARMLSSLIATQRCRIYSTRSDVHGSPVAPPSLLCGQLPRFGRAHGRVEARGTDVKADKGAAPHVAPESVRVVDRYAWIVKTRRNQRSMAAPRRDLRATRRPPSGRSFAKGPSGLPCTREKEGASSRRWPALPPPGGRLSEHACRALQVDLAAIGRGVARDRRDQRAAVREAEDALYQPLAERSAADDARAAVVVQRTSEHLARGGGSAVDPDLHRRQEGVREG